MSRSYLSKRQVKFERDSLDVQIEKHRRLIEQKDAAHKLWDPVRCKHEGPNCSICSSMRTVFDNHIEWSERDLLRWNKKVERLERELSRKRIVKRSIKKQRRERRAAEWVARGSD